MTARGWLSTWSGLSSHAKLADTMPLITVPTILVHPTADTEIRLWQAKEIVDNSGAADTTYVELAGAPHYLEGHRPEALGVRVGPARRLRDLGPAVHVVGPVRVPVPVRHARREGQVGRDLPERDERQPDHAR